MTAVPTVERLRALGLAAGLTALEVTSAEPFDEVRVTLVARKDEGLHGGMQFTYRRPEVSTDPDRALAGAQAIVVGALGYLGEEPGEPPAGPHARVARYAWTDHYADLRRALTVVADELTTAGWRARVLVDDNALVDRAAAHRAGLGWWGKNANLLLPGLGSWYVLGSVVTDAPLVPSGAVAEDRCGSCRRCLDACPTGAITAPGVVDARRCLSWLLQMEGPFPREHRVTLGGRIYGCDDCQDVCPPNRRSPRTDVSSDAAWVSVATLLDPDDAVVLAHADRWYIPRREVRYVRRNALVVLGNVGDPADPEVERLLRDHLQHADPLLRSHAVWAARRLGREDLLPLVADDTDPAVLDELHA